MADINFPAKLQFLFQPKRYKVAYGGRGSGKSWGFARALLLIGAQRPIRVLCARELQNSIKDSVHKLLSDQIKALGLEHVYEIQQASIKNALGTEFSFEGIRHNVNKIKSYEGVDICWVEEANSVSHSSWETLIPTIRKEYPDGTVSEIWVTFNPELEDDDTFVRFVTNTPDIATVVKMNWQDNPWFPNVLRAEMEELKAKDYDSYLNVWEGHCRVVLEGAVYANELRETVELGRITKVHYDHTKPVDIFADLGYADNTSLWFAQAVGMEYRAINFYQNRLKAWDHYLLHMQKLGYIYGTLWLPHDAKAKQLGTGRSIEELSREKGWKVRIVPKLSLTDGINAARTIFPSVYFDEEKCKEGLQALRHYRYETTPGSTAFSSTPLHDENSHAADGFRYMAVALRQPKRQRDLPEELRNKIKKKTSHMFLRANSGNTGWMR